MPIIHLVSFADGAFASRRDSFRKEAVDMNMYSSIKIHDALSLPQDFIREHGQFIKQSTRGFGYWIWKYRIILDKLLEMDDHHILVYADAGFTHNPNGRDRMIEYCLIAQQSPYGMLSFAHPYLECQWTKQDLAIRLGVENNLSVMKTSQLGGGLWILIKNDKNISLLNECLQIAAEENYRYIDDTPSLTPNDYRFVEHRHDQSISSLIRKCRGTEVTFYETEAYEKVFERYGDSWPLWATRSKI